MPVPSDRVRGLAAAAGLGLATAAWLVAQQRTPGFEPVRQSLSQLQRAGTGTRPLMTAGLAVLGAGLLAVAPVLGRVLASRAAGALVRVAGAATLLGAAFPLAVVKGYPQDVPHTVAAATGYVAVSVLPLLGGRRLSGAASTVSYAMGALTTLAMAGTVPLHAVSGGLQRFGLTLGCTWVVVVALAGRPPGR